jgi:hypothetical protein
MADYKSITGLGFAFEDGLENASGIQEQAYLIAVSHLKTEGKPATAGNSASALATIATSHALVTGKSAILVNPLYGKSGVATKLSGEELSKVFESDVELFIPQISAALLGGAAAIKNMRFIVLVRRPGQLTGFWQIGTGGMPAKVQDIAGGFGTGPTGEVGLKISLKAFDIVPMYEYTAELPAVGA